MRYALSTSVLHWFTRAALADNLFGRQGNQALLEALKESQSIRTIDLEGVLSRMLILGVVVLLVLIWCACQAIKYHLSRRQ